MYYLRSTTKVSARKALAVDTSETKEVVVEVPVPVYTPEPEVSTDKVFSAAEALQCSIDNPDDCEACGS
jgi:hypothetical protein